MLCILALTFLCETVFCGRLKEGIESVMGCQFARASPLEVVNYFKSFNCPRMHPWCFLTLIHTKSPFRRTHWINWALWKSVPYKLYQFTYLISCFFLFFFNSLFFPVFFITDWKPIKQKLCVWDIISFHSLLLSRYSLTSLSLQVVPTAVQSTLFLACLPIHEPSPNTTVKWEVLRKDFNC